MTEAARGTAKAFDATVKIAESEGRRLTHAERLTNPFLQREIEAQKAQAIASAEAAVERAKTALHSAEIGLAQAKKENA